MTTFEFLSYLHSLDIKLWIENDQLSINAPKGVINQELREELKRRKAELMTVLQEAHLPAQQDLPSIQPMPRDRALPLSFAQQRLWLLDQIETESSAYSITAAIRLQGDLNLSHSNKR